LKHVEMLKALLEYADKNNITLKLNEEDIKYVISREYESCIKHISEIKVDTAKLLYIYSNKGTIDITYSDNSELSERLEKIKKLTNKNSEIIITESVPSVLLPSTSSSKVSTSQTSSEKSDKKNDKKINEKSNEKANSKGDLAVVLYNFSGTNSKELTIQKDEYLIVTDWNVKNGWASGYKRDDPQKKGIFPYPLVRKCSNNEENKNGNSSSSDNGNSSTVNNDPLPSYEESNNTQLINATAPVSPTPVIYQNPNPYYPYAMPYYPQYSVQQPPVLANPQYPIQQQPVPINPQYAVQQPLISVNPQYPVQQPPVPINSQYAVTPNQQYAVPVPQNPVDQQAPVSSNQQYSTPTSPSQGYVIPSNQQPTAPPSQSYPVLPNQQYPQPYLYPYVIPQNYR